MDKVGLYGFLKLVIRYDVGRKHNPTQSYVYAVSVLTTETGTRIKIRDGFNSVPS